LNRLLAALLLAAAIPPSHRPVVQPPRTHQAGPLGGPVTKPRGAIGGPAPGVHAPPVPHGRGAKPPG